MRTFFILVFFKQFRGIWLPSRRDKFTLLSANKFEDIKRSLRTRHIRDNADKKHDRVYKTNQLVGPYTLHRLIETFEIVSCRTKPNALHTDDVSTVKGIFKVYPDIYRVIIIPAWVIHYVIEISYRTRLSCTGLRARKKKMSIF